MNKYKLTVVDKDDNQEYEIGTFDNEYQLEKWARENLGELKKAEQDQRDSQSTVLIRPPRPFT